MKKITLVFPTYDSLWLFKEKTNAINIRVKPRRNIISGLFEQQEIELAIQQFSANKVASNNRVPEKAIQ